MENNFSDKQMRNKLKGLEHPFDPNAWEQMEAMLDEKKERRGFFWWWTGGIAALLLLGVVGYEFKVQGSRFKVGNSKFTVYSPQSTVNIGESSSVAGEKGNANSQNQISSIEQSTSKNQSAKSVLSAVKNKSTKKKNDEPSSVNFLSGNKSRQNAISKISYKKEERATAFAVPKKSAEDILVSSSAITNPLSEIVIEVMKADELKGTTEIAIASIEKKDKDEDAVLLKKEKIFNYSIGAVANITGTTLGKQANPAVIRPVRTITPATYAVGFVQEFLFWKRFAVTNSVLFSQTAFKVNNAKTTDISVSVLDYSCRITELDIPVGLKFYPVSKPKFRFYIATGIINHIKLKETFNYTTPPDTNSNTLTAFSSNSALPQQTTFADQATAPNTLGQSAASSTKDFSINSAKRYYASFYASLGAELIIKKHFILFTEPLFYMALQKIGVQDKLKYNIGGSGGFRYEF